jgi:protein-tyrosine-phosphatase
MEILFVCTGNICRSPMAEGLMVHMLAARSMGGFRVRSAGTVALDGRPAEPHAVAAARELGVDIAAHRARSLDPAMAQQADLILVMEQGQADLIARVLPADRQAQRLRLLGTYVPDRESAEIDDPYGQPLDAYRSCAGSIQQCLTAVLEQIAPMSTAT